MTKRLLLQLLPIGLLATAYVSLDSRIGLSDGGQFWVYSCRISKGASVGIAGFRSLSFSQEAVPFIGNQAMLGNLAMGC